MLDLYKQLTERIMLKGSKIIPELFKMIADEDEAALLLAMPGTPEQLAEKVGESVEDVNKMCGILYHKGLAFKSFKGGQLGYKMCRDMVQFHDATILWPQAPAAYHELWQNFMEVEWPGFARMFEKMLPRPITRVIPIEKSIDTGKQQILDAESVSTVIKNAKVLAVTPCTCRLIAKKCDNPVDVCLQVDNAAKYTIDRGTGRVISREEAMDILEKCNKAGLVHVTMNKAHVGHFICNCCGCCCQAMPLLISSGLKICDPSRFQAQVDPETCSLCGTCTDRCYFNALEEKEINENIVMQVDPEKCMGCGLCQVTCPEEAISLLEVRTSDFIPA